jgi:hypothetical protein
MKTPLENGRRHGVALAIGALTIGVLVGPTAAAAATAPAESPAASASAGTDLGPRLERACLRIPNLQIRTDRLAERLQGSADTRGSLLWLQAQIDRAEADGRDQLVTVLENRLAVRTATVDVLELRRTELADLAARCAELGVEP